MPEYEMTVAVYLDVIVEADNPEQAYFRAGHMNVSQMVKAARGYGQIDLDYTDELPQEI